MYFITIKRMLEVCFSAHPNIQYRAVFLCNRKFLRIPHYTKRHILLCRRTSKKQFSKIIDNFYINHLLHFTNHL